MIIVIKRRTNEEDIIKSRKILNKYDTIVEEKNTVVGLVGEQKNEY